MIQTWSCSSTQTPIVMPSSQWLGRGFGHSGSTSNTGACTTSVWLACRSRSACVQPSTASSATNAAPTALRFVIRASSGKRPGRVYANSAILGAIGSQFHPRRGTSRVRAGRAGARHPRRSPRPGLRQARRPGAETARAHAAQGDARRRRAAAPGRFPRLHARRQLAARRGRPVARRRDRALRGRRAARQAEAGRCPRLARVGPLLRRVRKRARAFQGAAPRQRHRALLEPGAARRAARVPGALRALRLLDPAAARAARHQGQHRAALPAAGRRGEGVRPARRLRPRAPRSALAPGGTAVRVLGLPAHPARHRPPSLRALPRRPVPALLAARGHRHRLHRRALHHPHHDRARPRPGRALVPAADRAADRGVDLLHGDRERPRQQPGAALGHRLRLRPGARLRLRLRPAAAPAVRRIPPHHLAPRLQRRRRARPAPRPDRPRPAAQLPLPLRSRARRHDHHLASRGSHSLALAPRALGSPEQIPLAHARRRDARQRDSLADRTAGARRVGVDNCSQKITQVNPNNAWTSRAEAFIVRPMSHLKFTHRLALLLGVLVLSPVVWAGTPQAYITNLNDNTVSVIDTASNTVTATVPVGTFPNGVAVAPDGAHVYVANVLDGTVSVIDTGSNAVTATVPVGGVPVGVAVTPDGARVYVASFSGSTVSVIATASNSVTATVAVGQSPEGVVVTPDGTRVYVANFNANTVSVIATASNTVTATVTVGVNPAGVAVTPDGAHVYVANQNSNNVSMIATASNTVTGTVTVGSLPRAFGKFISSSGDTTPPLTTRTAQPGTLN